VKNKTENIVLNEERIAEGLQHKVLHERLGGVLICLELSHHIDQDAPVKHGVAINGGDVVTNFLKSEAVYLLHYLSQGCIFFPKIEFFIKRYFNVLSFL